MEKEPDLADRRLRGMWHRASDSTVETERL
jgi:hypothetical protein